MDREDDLARRVRHGHATAKHVHEFQDLNVKTPDQYESHVASVLRDPQTQRFTAYTTEQKWRQADVYYHPPSNTLIVDPANRKHEPTARRPPDGVATFELKHREAERVEKRPISVTHGRDGKAQQSEQPTSSREAKPEQSQAQPDGQQPRRFDPQARRERLAQEAEERGPPTHDHDHKRGR